MKKSLSLEQTKAILTAVHSAKRPSALDEALLVAILLSGSNARTWTWNDALADVINLPMGVYQALRAFAAAHKLTIFPFNHAGFTKAHWINGVRLQKAVFTASTMQGKPFTTHEVTRRLKRYAKKAGIDAADISLRTLANTHKELIRLYVNADQLAEALGIYPTPAMSSQVNVKWEKLKRDSRLHGIGRRSRQAVTG